MKRGSLTKERIIDEALNIVSTVGFDQLTYNGLARSLGIQPQSMYRYVANISDVRTSVIATYMTALTQAMYQELVPYSGADALRQLAISFVTYTQTGVSFTDMVSGLITYRQNLEVAEAVNGLHDLVTRLIQSVTSQAERVEPNVHLFLNFVIGSLTLLTVRQESRETNLEEYEANVDRILSLLK
ncbi:TetR/AcrR family transcriptional regulator [Lacticaseibacillus brantae]|uniref:Transcriptional regulator n=1 Tax=Lacticaseibacillus brantae DSM 23927 TaxID=1423727 RepID=A0A0R2BB08_9LACO|nr:TetR/AcrR family transcriptional regulator [Lacticaseibacillus brantae]KRM72972.1 transcriptional regulator [Lacticaseibacillus brantae DSM 23927]